jgi:hypothetical protein
LEKKEKKKKKKKWGWDLYNIHPAQPRYFFVVLGAVSGMCYPNVGKEEKFKKSTNLVQNIVL